MLRALKLSSLFLMTMLVMLMLQIEANAESLWRNQSMYDDRCARNVGDIVTIIIAENANATQAATNEREKQLRIGGSSNANLDATATTTEAAGATGQATATDGVLSIGGKVATFLNSLASYIPLFGATISGGSSYDAENGQTRRGVLNARISVVVDEIDESGNLVLKGAKTVNINSEEQVIEIRGRCRPDDITAENTINSNLIADASIRYNGETVYAESGSFLGNVWNKVADWLF